MKFSLMTYNIHKGFSASGKFTLPKLRDQLQIINPDIVCLQEVQGEHHEKSQKHQHWPEVDQASYLAERHWPHVVYAENANYQQGHHGNGIISHYEIDHWDNINVSNRDTASRSFLHSCIRLSEDTCVHVLCIHLGLFELEREEQFEKLVYRVNSHINQGEPLIIAGDFNDWRKRAGDHLSDLLDLQEVFMQQKGKHAKTFPTVMPVLSVDRVYYRNLTVSQCEILKRKPWNTLSDHYPLLVDFEV